MVGIPYSKDIPAEIRFFTWVEKTDDCWIWKGSCTGGYNKKSYGQFRWDDGKTKYAHRWSYIFFIGQIPTGYVVHHKCHNTVCVNPAHLESTTRTDNSVKYGKTNPTHINSIKTHCIHGHPLSGDNLKVYDARHGAKRSIGKGRACIMCLKANSLKQRIKKRLQNG